MHSSSVTLESVYRGLSTRYATIRNLTIKFLVREEIIHGRPRKGPTERGDKKFPHEWARIEYRIHDKKRYNRYEIPAPWLAKVEGRKPVFVEHLCWDGSVGTRFEESVGTGSIADQLEEAAFENFVFRYLDWPVSETELRTKDHTFLPSSIQRPDTRLLPDIQNLSGHDCHVVEVPGVDRLWLDISKGWALLKRELRFGAGQPLRQVTVADGWVEVGKGVWLPKKIVREYYCGLDHPKEQWNTIASRVTIDAEYENKPLPDDAFSIEFPAGTYVFDGISGSMYRKPGPSGDAFDDAVQTAMKMHPHRPPAARTSVILRANIVLVLFALLVFGLRRFLKS